MSCRDVLPVQEWYTAAELAGLDGIPGSDRRARDFLKNACQGRKRQGSKAMEFSFSSLPQVTQEAILARALTNAGTGGDLLETSQPEPEREPARYEDLNEEHNADGGGSTDKQTNANGDQDGD